jgi:hypothetical protein
MGRNEGRPPRPAPRAVVDGIDPAQQEQLVACGLVPGRPLRVQPQRPTTIVLIDEAEPVLEASVARRIRVRKV